MSTSQPSVGLPLQLAKPVTQLSGTSWQLPATHWPSAFGGEQSSPQAPQCSVVMLRSASQPSRWLWLQSPWFGGHFKTQVLVSSSSSGSGSSHFETAANSGFGVMQSESLTQVLPIVQRSQVAPFS